MFPDLFLKLLLASVVHHESPNVTTALNHAEDYGLILAAGSGNDALPFGLVHVARLAADETLVYFDLTAKLCKSPAPHDAPNPMEHEPCGFLGDFQISGNFAGTDAVLAIGNQPGSSGPLVQTNRRVLENRPHFNGELLLAIPAPPQIARGDDGDVFGTATWTDRAVWPAPLRDEGQRILRIGKELNCFEKTAGHAFHEA